MSLKKIISKFMYLITSVFVMTIFVIVLVFQIKSEQNRACESAEKAFLQFEQILVENQQELEQIEAEYKQTCVHNAEIVARIIESDPTVINDVEELKSIAESVEIDEIHIFDSTGRIFAGTHPEYFDYTFDSGEQMMFFKPLLEDKTLALVQDITPNTAEGKSMQYSALWSSNGEYIVQVGMEPENVLKVREKNTISYIFSLVKVNTEADHFAIDPDTGKVLGTTKTELLGASVLDMGLNLSEIKSDSDGFHAWVDGEYAFCVFEKIDDVYIGRIISCTNMYQRIPASVIILVLCLVAVAYALAKAVVAQMGTYEYNCQGKELYTTEHIPVILSLEMEQLQKWHSDKDGFVAFLDKLREKPVQGEAGVYQCGDKFIRIEELRNDDDVFGVIVDITSDVLKRREIEEERDVDLLTGLYNRRGLDVRMSRLFLEPDKLKYYALVMIDADGLKGINDTYGHEKGDIYLKRIGGIINNFGVQSSIASRQGGDEFVLFLYEYGSRDELEKTIQTLEYIQNQSTVHLDDNINVPVRFSLGYSIAKGNADWQELLKEADEKMYSNKLERKKMSRI